MSTSYIRYPAANSGGGGGGPVTTDALYLTPITNPSPLSNGLIYYDSSLNQFIGHENGLSIALDRNVLNVKDYGAKGDGTTNDTIAIQAAINAVGVGGAIYYPQGTYRVTNLTSPAAVRHYGAGRHQTTLLALSGSTGYMFTDQGNAAKIIIQDMAFYANNCNYTSIVRLGFTVNGQWGTEGLIENVFIRDCPTGTGLDLNANVGIVKSASIWNCNVGVNILGNANFFSDIIVAGFFQYGIFAADSFWNRLELEAPDAAATPVYMDRQVKIWGVVISISNATTITNLFQMDAGSSNCTVDGLVVYTAGSGTYTNLVSGTGLTFGVSAPNAVTSGAVPVFSGTSGQLLANSSVTVSGTALSTGILLAGQGSNTAPGVSFTGAGNSGMWFGSSSLQWTVSGVNQATLGSSGLTLVGTLGASNFSGSSSGTNTGDQTSISGNAATATALQTARAINGVNFDGTAAVTVTAAAGTLTGTILNSTVVTSSLTSVGTLASLTVTGTATCNSVQVGSAANTISALSQINVPSTNLIVQSGTSQDIAPKFQTQTTNQTARLYLIQAASSSSGGSYVCTQIASGSKWSMGLDTPNSTRFAIANTDGFATSANVFFQINTSGGITLGAASGTEQHTVNTFTGTTASGVGTLTNLPSGKSGNPTGYWALTINGSTAYVPFW